MKQLNDKVGISSGIMSIPAGSLWGLMGWEQVGNEQEWALFLHQLVMAQEVRELRASNPGIMGGGRGGEEGLGDGGYTEHCIP